MLIGRLWRWSTVLHAKGHRRLAQVVKATIFILVRALLPPEAEVGGGVTLVHHGIGTVVHPNVVVGRDVRIFHGVTLGADLPLADSRRLVIDDEVVIGAGAVVLGAVHLGTGAVVGANAVVTRDVAPGMVVAGNPARVLGERGQLDIKLREAAAKAAPVVDR